MDFARYVYDARGDLVTVTDADGFSTQFHYGHDHELSRIEHPDGLAVFFVYDQQKRCVETWGAYPGRKDPALADGLPEFLADGTTRAKGIHHCRLDFLDESCTEVADSLRVRRIISNPDGTVGKAVGGKGNVTTRDFDPDGNVVGQIDATEAHWRWQYDRLGKVTRFVDPLGAEVSIERNIFGQEERITDQEGVTTTIERDPSGEITRVGFPGGTQNSFVLDPHGATTKLYDARGGLHEFELDGHTNRVAHRYPNGATYRFEYDYWGRLIREVDPSGAIRTFGYCNRGLITSATDRTGKTRSFDYDSMGRLVLEVEPDGGVHRFEYGGYGWLHRSVWADGSEVRALYDREGLIRTLVNERGETFNYDYDSEGLLAAERDFLDRVTRYSHDLLGRITAVKRGENKMEFERDACGRIRAVLGRDDATRTFEYNRRGQLVRAEDSTGGSFEWFRDPAGVIVRENIAIDGQTYVVESERDGVGDRSKLHTSLGLTLETRRDLLGQITHLTERDAPVVSFERNESGQVLRRNLAAGGVFLDDWDAEGRLRRRQVAPKGAPGPGPEPEWVGAWNPSAQTWLYDYTPAGELLKQSASSGREVTLEYDRRHRLLSRDDGGRIESFEYDPASNVFEKGLNVPRRQYEKGDVLVRRGDVEYAYDQLGFLVEKRHASNPNGEPALTRYSWNGWGLLDAVETPDGLRVEFRYDAFARRLAKQVRNGQQVVEATHYVWDILSMVHEVELPGAPDGGRKVTSYLYPDNDDVIPLGERPAAESGAWTYYVADFNGTTEALVDGAGRPEGWMERSAFGRTRPVSGSRATTAFRYPGQFEDKETGLHYNRYRYYDPDVGRYISPDPIGLVGGLNLYAYAVNPIGWTDPMGLQHALTVGGSGVAAMDPPALGRGNPSSGTLNYHAGNGGRTTSPPLMPGTPELNAPAFWHSEQRFAHDLIAQSRRPPPGRFQGRNFELGGTYPPCPVCHGAMMRAAQESGADINYSWGDPPQTVNYAGGSGTPRATGANAQALLGAYGHQSDGSWQQGQSGLGTNSPTAYQGPPPGRQAVQPNQAWGYNINDGAWNEYNRQMGR